MQSQSSRGDRGLGSVYYDKSRGAYVATIVRGKGLKPLPIRVSGPDNKATRRAAVVKREEYLRDAQTNETLLAPGRKALWTVSDWCDHWLETTVLPSYDSRSGARISGKDPTTYANNEQLVRVYLRPYFKRVLLGDLVTSDVVAWQRARAADLMKRGCSVVQVNRARKILVRALKHAIKLSAETGLTRNVASLVDPLDYTPEKVKAPVEAEMAKLLKLASTDQRLGAAVSIDLLLGLRRQETGALQWRDIDFEARTLTIRRRVNRLPVKALTGHQAVATVKTKTVVLVRPGVKMGDAASFAVLPLPDFIADILRRHAAGLQLLGLPVGPEAYVFPSPEGEVMDPHRLNYWFRALAKQVGMTDTGLHQLRHNCAHYLLKRGVPMWQVQAIMRHARIATTIDTYGHFDPSDHVEALGRMSGVLESLAG